jgi:4-amino-4-deoxy-L-arabinose transferase-like glycosyltransferase
LVRVSKLRPAQLALLAIVSVAFMLRFWHLFSQLSGILPYPEQVAENSDIEAFAQWASQIAAGDWLCQNGFHPYMDWMRGYASMEQFEQWWGGKEIYHQNPLYPYLLAISYLVSGGSSVPLLVFQVLLSVVSVLLVYDLGRRFIDERAGLLAAGLLAVFPPSIVFDSLLLRASLNSSLTLLSIWLLVRLKDRQNGRLALSAGVCVAASFMLRPTGLLLLMAGPVLLLLFAELRASWRRWLPALVAGVVLVLGPFVARNLIVGAPALSFSTRGPETVIHSHTKSADPGFMSLPSAEEFRQYMDDGSGSMAAAIRTSIDSWPENSLAWWLWHEWQKVICVFRDYEYSNNVNFYFYRRATPLLGFLPTFGWFVGLGFVGVILLACCGRQRRLALIILVAMSALFAGSILGFALGRYRLPFAVLMTIPAGAAMSLMIRWFRSGSGRLVGAGSAALAVATGVSVLSFTLFPQRVEFGADGRTHLQSSSLRSYYERSERLRPQEFVESALYAFRKQSDKPKALQILDAYVREYQEFYNEVAPEARRLATPNCWVFLRRELRQRYVLVADVLREIGETKLADQLLGKAKTIEQQLEKMRDG